MSIAYRKIVVAALFAMVISTYSDEVISKTEKLRVYKTPDPEFIPLHDSDIKLDQQWNDSMIWLNPFSDYAYCMALQTGLSYLPSKYWGDIADAKIHPLQRGIISKPDKYIVKDYLKTDIDLFDKTARQAEAHNSPKCALYACYQILGKDTQGNPGTFKDITTGWLPDPINAAAYIENVMLHLEQHKGKIWAVFVGDELIYHVENSGMEIFKKRFEKSPSPFMKQCYEEIKSKYGFGKFSIPYNLDAKHPDYPFCLLAYRSWLIDRCNEIFKKLKSEIKKKHPDVAIISQDLMDNHNYPEVEFENWNQYADIGTFQLAVGTTPHSQYSMYLAKLIKDVSGLKRIMCVPHDFTDCCYWSAASPEEMQELYSQVIRGGITAFHFWPGAYEKAIPYSVSIAIGFPYSWDRMMGMAKFIKAMPPLKYPENPETIIIRSNDTLLAEGAAEEKTLYAFTQLGQNARGWFKFVTDWQVINAKVNLSDYKIAYIADLKYSRPEFADKLIKFVENGGIVICADPLAFEYNINSKSMIEFRERLFNVRIDGLRKKSSGIVLEDKTILKVYKESYNTKVISQDAEIVARFADGLPAIIMNKVGKGRTYYFASSPFIRATIADEHWGQFIRDFHVKLGGKTGYDIWRFKLPDNLFPEVKEQDSSVKGKFCLTGNFAFWDKSVLTEDENLNINTGGNYAIERKGGTQEFTFKAGPLTSRLQALAPELKMDSATFVAKFDKNRWSETFEGEEKASICFDFNAMYELNVLRIYFNSKLPPVTVKTSADQKDWSVVATTPETKTADSRDITFIDINIDSGKKARYLKIEMESDFTGKAVLVETEIWGAQ